MRPASVASRRCSSAVVVQTAVFAKASMRRARFSHALDTYSAVVETLRAGRDVCVVLVESKELRHESPCRRSLPRAKFAHHGYLVVMPGGMQYAGSFAAFSGPGRHRTNGHRKGWSLQVTRYAYNVRNVRRVYIHCGETSCRTGRCERVAE